MTELFEKLKNGISIDNMYQTMGYLVDQVGERLSGTEEMKKATRYIHSRLKEYGIDSRIDHFPMYQSYPGSAELKMIAPAARRIEARPVCHIESTGEDGLSGELIYLGSGAYEDYEGIDVKDKIVLTDMNWSPGRPEKARIAWEMGAKALIIMNWGKAEDNLIQMGAVKAQWGNPTPETEKEIVQLTVISISRADGEALMELCSRGPVKVWLKADASREWITADQPVGKVYGGKSNGQFILVGSHVDAWGKSAICNSSGNALSLELARLCQENREELRRDVVFVFWDGHEIAEGGGSTWYCDANWSDLNENCAAYINIDNLAIRGTVVPGVESLPELKNLLMDGMKKFWETDGAWHHAYKGGGDSSFFGIGVPYISFATEYTEERLKELNYAFYGPWLHSDSDTLDKIDPDLLLKHLEYFAYILESLVNEEILPYDLELLSKDVQGQWQAVYDGSGKAKPLLSSLEPAVLRYEEALKRLNIRIKKGKKDALSVKQLNELLLFCERQTSMFRCESGRYGQDSCCSLQSEKPIPALERAVGNYNKSAEGSHEYYLWETQILRVKNMVYDSLNNTARFIELGMSVLE